MLALRAFVPAVEDPAAPAYCAFFNCNFPLGLWMDPTTKVGSAKKTDLIRKNCYCNNTVCNALPYSQHKPRAD